MLNITDEEKALFKESGHFPGYIFTFSDINLTITNDIIHDQAVTVKESVMDSSELTLGGCIASSIEFEVSEIMANDITGHEFTAKIEVTDADDNVELSNLPMGTYTPAAVQQVDDKDYKKVTAYDRLTMATADVTEWYDSFFVNDSTHTVKETRESLLTYLGIPYVSQNLTNDTYVCEKTVDSVQMVGLDVLKMLCTINGGFGRMNRFGEFEVITLEEITGDEPDTSEDYRTVKYEEYTSEAVTGIIVKGTTDDVGIDVGDTETNPYVITGNIFLYNNATEAQRAAIRTVATNILNLIKNIEYRPHTSNIDGLPYMECGDIFKIEKDNDTLESYIFGRTLSGVAYLQDQYEAKGTQERKNEVSATSEMYRNAGKQFEFVVSLDGLRADLTNYETGTETKFEIMDGKIDTKVSTEEMESSIEQSADQIKSTVGTAQSKYQEPEQKYNPTTYTDSPTFPTSIRYVCRLQGGKDTGDYSMVAVCEGSPVFATRDATGTTGWGSVYATQGINMNKIISFPYTKTNTCRVLAVGNKDSSGYGTVFWSDSKLTTWNRGQFTDIYDEFYLVDVVYDTYSGVCLALDDAGRFCYSTDLTNWYQEHIDSTKTWGAFKVFCAGGYFIVSAYDNEIRYIETSVFAELIENADPETTDFRSVWEKVDLTTLRKENNELIYFNDIAYRPQSFNVIKGMYVAAGTVQSRDSSESAESEYTGGIWYSYDLKKWFPAEAYDEELFQITFLPIDYFHEEEADNYYVFFATGSDGRTCYSLDGKEWKNGQAGSGDLKYGIAKFSQGSGAITSASLFYASQSKVTRVYFELTGIVISLYGYGNPTGNKFYEKVINVGKYYLDQETGNAYLLSYDDDEETYIWSLEDTYKKIYENIYSEISQTNSEIVLKVDADGKIVSVDLKSDPSEGSSVEIIADKISMKGSELIELLSDGTLDLSGRNIKIESDYFNVNENGEVKASAIEIDGGHIDIKTNKGSEDVLMLSGVTGLENVTITGGGTSTEHPNYGGVGTPSETIGSTANDFYYQIDTGELYQRGTDKWNLYPSAWYEVEDTTKICVTEISITTDGGFYNGSYFYLDRDGDFIKQEDSVRQNTGNITWTITAKAGGTSENYITKTANIGIEIEKFTGALYEDFQHRLVSDTPLKLGKLEIGEGWTETDSGGRIIAIHDSPNFTSSDGIVTLNDGKFGEIPITTANITTANITTANISDLSIRGKKMQFLSIVQTLTGTETFIDVEVENLDPYMPVYANEAGGTIVEARSTGIVYFEEDGSLVPKIRIMLINESGYAGTTTFSVMCFVNPAS